MTLFEVAFSFEASLETGNSLVLCESMKKARTAVKEMFEQKAQELIINAEKYGADKPDDMLTADLRRIHVVPITKESFCKIINSNGGQFVEQCTELGTFTMQVGRKRITFTPAIEDDNYYGSEVD